MTTVLLITLAILFGILIFILIKVKDPTKKRDSLDKAFVLRKWQEVETLMALQKPSGYMTAILEADKLVDYVLKAKVGSDGSMADRMKEGRKLFSRYETYDSLWYAHKTRNKIAHEAEHEIYFAEAKKVIGYFKSALRDLSVL